MKTSTTIWYWLCSLIIGLGFSLSSHAAFNANPPSSGAVSTGTYRNLAAEMDKTDATSKLSAAWDRMFGTDSNYRLYVPLNENMAYIYAPDSNDVRSEGQSWGMTIAVMMNRRDEFDALWNFAAAHQRNNSGALAGTFAWQVKFNNNQPYKADAAPAPDGELYFAFALLSADARWGSVGDINYYSEAMSVLKALQTHLMYGPSNHNVIMFSPHVSNVTDPSYHIPAFYNYFGDRIKNSAADQRFWHFAAQESRKFLQAHLASAPNGLPTYLASTNGQPLTGNIFNGQPNPAHWYEFDAWRVALNIGLDAHMYGAQNWHRNGVSAIHNFLRNQHNSNNCYMQKYENGIAVSNNNHCANHGQKGANAVGLLASNSTTNANFFFNEFWASSFPSGEYRYYDGSLYMLSLLHATGQFRFYKPGDSNSPILNLVRPTGNTITVRASGTSGSERIRLRIGDAEIATWTLSTTMSNYTATTPSRPGNIFVEFFNDAPGRDVRVDYISVNNHIRQAEHQLYNTAQYANKTCGGGVGFSERMHCNGAIGFGRL